MKDTMRGTFNSVARDLLATDPRAVVVLAAIGADAFGTDLSPDIRSRVVDVGIREQAMIGVAGGLALEGFRPIVMTYAPFLVERPFEQIKLSLTHQNVHATLISVGGSWDASGAGRTHQAPEDVALMSTLPGWTIHVPGHPEEAEAAIRLAHASGTSHYVRLTADQNRTVVSTSGRVVTLRRGSDRATTILVVGPIVDDVLDATTDMDMTILYTNIPFPLDAVGLSASVVGNHVVVVEPYLEGTAVTQVAKALSNRPMMIDAIGVADPELRRYGTPAELKAAHGLDATGIRNSLVGLRQLKAG
jgi:transketolase